VASEIDVLTLDNQQQTVLLHSATAREDSWSPHPSGGKTNSLHGKQLFEKY